MPDLIRLVHGNTLTKSKLVREFSIYWELKSAGKLPFEEWKPAQSSPSADSADVSLKNTSLENAAPQIAVPVGSPPKLKTDGTNTIAAAGTSSPHIPSGGGRVVIANRQLEMRITSIAVYEARPVPATSASATGGSSSATGTVMRRCWFVLDEVLQRYAEKLQPFGPLLPNTWRYVSNATKTANNSVHSDAIQVPPHV